MYGRYGPREESKYDVAQVCLNGHLINQRTQRFPQHNKKHCSNCGAATINACPKCEASIRGEYGVGALYTIPVPAFCYECGAAYPWTESRLQAAHDLTIESDLAEADKKTLLDSIDGLAKNTPQSDVLATRVQKIFRRVGEVAPKALRQLFVEISSETAKKILLDGRPI